MQLTFIDQPTPSNRSVDPRHLEFVKLRPMNPLKNTHILERPIDSRGTATQSLTLETNGLCR